MTKGVLDIGHRRLQRAFVGSLGSVLFVALFCFLMFIFVRMSVAEGQDHDWISRMRIMLTLSFGLPLMFASLVSWVWGAVGIAQILRHHDELRRGSKAIASYLLEAAIPLGILALWISAIV